MVLVGFKCSLFTREEATEKGNEVEGNGAREEK
jgi:hypothetical protein